MDESVTIEKARDRAIRFSVHLNHLEEIVFEATLCAGGARFKVVCEVFLAEIAAKVQLQSILIQNGEVFHMGLKERLACDALLQTQLDIFLNNLEAFIRAYVERLVVDFNLMHHFPLSLALVANPVFDLASGIAVERFAPM